MTAVAEPVALAQRLTPDELLRLPNHRTLELVNGQPVEIEVSYLSSRTESRIVRVLEGFIEHVPVAAVFTSGMIYRCFQKLAVDPNRMRRPDVSVLRLDRFQAIGDPNPGLLRVPPDLAVEVLSTHDVIADVDEKLFEYEVGGFPLVWVVNPIRQTVTVHPFPGKPFILSADDPITAESALPGFSCKVADLFPPAASVEPG